MLGDGLAPASFRLLDAIVLSGFWMGWRSNTRPENVLTNVLLLVQAQTYLKMCRKMYDEILIFDMTGLFYAIRRDSPPWLPGQLR